MVRISPSILSADQSDLKSAMEAAAEGGADYIHVDVMDLHFVPNLTIGPSVVADLGKNSSLPLDVHLMVDDPAGFADILTAQIRKRVKGKALKFEDLANYGSQAIAAAVRGTDIARLALALKGAGEETFKAVLDSLSKEQGAELVQQMGSLGTVHRDDIGSAREEIVQGFAGGSDINPVKYLVAHQEACIHLDRVLNHFRSLGYAPGVSLNPATPVSTIEQVLPLCEIVVVMSVNPGFGGQEFIPYTLDKVRQLKSMISEKHLGTVIEIDGGIKVDNASYAARAGCDILVAGAAVFNKHGSPAENIKALKDACAQTV